MYSAGYTEDLRRAVAHVRTSRPQARALTAAGYSLGASYLAKYVCEEGERCALAGAALFACMTDLVAGIARLGGSAAAQRAHRAARLGAAPAAALPAGSPRHAPAQGDPTLCARQERPRAACAPRRDGGSALLPTAEPAALGRAQASRLVDARVLVPSVQRVMAEYRPQLAGAHGLRLDDAASATSMAAFDGAPYAAQCMCSACAAVHVRAYVSVTLVPPQPPPLPLPQAPPRRLKNERFIRNPSKHTRL